MKIEIRSLFSGWQTVDRETAARFVSHLLRKLKEQYRIRYETCLD